MRRIGDREQRARRLVDAGIGRLRRQHHRDQKRVGIEVLELALGSGLAFRNRLNASRTSAGVQGFGFVDGLERLLVDSWPKLADFLAALWAAVSSRLFSPVSLRAEGTLVVLAL